MMLFSLLSSSKRAHRSTLVCPSRMREYFQAAYTQYPNKKRAKTTNDIPRLETETSFEIIDNRHIVTKLHQIMKLRFFLLSAVVLDLLVVVPPVDAQLVSKCHCFFSNSQIILQVYSSVYTAPDPQSSPITACTRQAFASRARMHQSSDDGEVRDDRGRRSDEDEML